MNFLIEQQVLDDALKTVQFALLTRPSLPVLNNVRIDALDDGVNFTLTDQEITISCKANANVTEIGSTTLPMRRLLSIVRRLPALPISFNMENDEFTELKSGEICFKIQGISTDEFPETLNSQFEHSSSVPRDIIRRLVINTSFATGNDPSRPIISGPLLKFEPDLFSCVATDGKRLAIETESISFKLEGLCVIPQKTTNALMKLLAGDGDVIISFDEKSVQFDFINEYGQATIINSKLIEGRFPRYEAIIPDEQDIEIFINRNEFADCLKRIALILNESSQGVKLIFTENKLTMHASTENDESTEEMNIDLTGPEQQIAFNPAYLLDPLKRLEDEKISLSFTNTHKAACMKNSGSFKYVLMPMRM